MRTNAVTKTVRFRPCQMRRLDPPDSSDSDIEPEDTAIKNAIRPSARKLILRRTTKTADES
ncbi:hypothetical protein BS618_22905 [Rhodococcus erythropolis]|nr:hypothetical protein BS618_22905 [Rhodococcus erythropolis]REK78084.1 hypothetical protein DVG80_31880 [Rhodococcus erythropolis]